MWGGDQAHNNIIVKLRPHKRFLLVIMVKRFFVKIVVSPASGEKMCSHPYTGDATAEKSLKKIVRNSTC